MKKSLSLVFGLLLISSNIFCVKAKDIKVEEAQVWLNNTYSTFKGYKSLEVDGNPGTITSNALVSALQIELGIEPTGIFGPKTEEKFNSLCGKLKFGDCDSDKPYIRILQHGLFCKGYNPTNVSGNFGERTSAAIIKLKRDAGFTNAKDSSVDGMWMKAILSSDAYVCRNKGDRATCDIQRSLNREYSRYSGIMPCDGHYSRDTNKALISAFQAEEGISEQNIKGCNGTFGPSTIERCPNLPNDSRYSKDKIKKFTKLLKYALYFNKVNYASEIGVESEEYDERTKDAVKRFQQFVGLEPNGIADRKTIMALMVSTGDPTRPVLGCDCATQLDSVKAEELYKAGYRYVGRYLTGFAAKKAPKNLTFEEYKAICDAGLKLFPIYQDGGYTKDYFTAEQGKKDAELAFSAARNLLIPDGAVIYFAVDYDFMDAQIGSKVMPYFEAIYNASKTDLNSHNYKIGIYGSRNICTRISERGFACSSFVSDMSTKYSGNYGYPLPANWAFDQIKEFRFSQNGASFPLDNDAVRKGENLGVKMIRDYIFYTSRKGGDFSNQAKAEKEYLESLGKHVVMVKIDSAEEFIKEWEKLGLIDGKEVGVDTLTIYSHGSHRSIMIQDGEGRDDAISVNGEDKFKTRNIRNLNELKAKKINMVNLWVCNGGNILTYENKNEDGNLKTNTASILSKKVIGGYVNAFDGNVSFGNPNRGLLGGKIRKGEPRLAQRQDGFYEIAKGTFHRPDAKPMGLVKYKNGELVQ